MGHYGRNGEGFGRVPPPYRSETFGQDGKASWGGGLGVAPCVGGPRGSGTVDNAGVL